MELQFDNLMRVVSVENLKAMCKEISGMCHRYWVDDPPKTGRTIKVWYSNPNEYGNEYPFAAVFPIFRNNKHVNVVIEIINTIREPKNWHGEGWQAFLGLIDCPKMWRNPTTNTWQIERKVKNEC